MQTIYLNRGEYPKYIKSPYSSITKETPNESDEQMSSRSKTLFQRRHPDGQRTHEKKLNVTHHQEMRVKTATRYHVTSVRMAVIKKMRSHKRWQGCGGKRESSRTVDGNVSWCGRCGRQYGGSSKMKTRTTLRSSNFTAGYCIQRKQH